MIEELRHDRCALVQHPQQVDTATGWSVSGRRGPCCHDPLLARHWQFEFVHEACIKYAELHKTPFVVDKEGERPPVRIRHALPGTLTSSFLVLELLEEEGEDERKGTVAPLPRPSMEQLKVVSPVAASVSVGPASRWTADGLQNGLSCWECDLDDGGVVLGPSQR